MCAWIVFSDHISFVVGRTLELVPDGFLTFGASQLLTPLTKDEIGRLLVNENVRSVRHRYHRDTFEELPGWVVKAGIFDYLHIDLDLLVDSIVMLKQIDCFECQACEWPDWFRSDASAFCQVVSDLSEATFRTANFRLRLSRF